MKAGMAILISVLVTTAVASGQLTPSIQPAGNEYTGVVAPTGALVRSGPGERNYACTELAGGTEVTVTGREAGWLMIEPPSGVFSVIRKHHVEVTPDGKTGIVVNDGTPVKPGGDLRTNRFYGYHRKDLNQGDRVQILPGNLAGYYKIKPPEGVVFWVDADKVTRKPAAREVIAPRRESTAPAPPTTMRTVQPTRERTEQTLQAVDAWKAAEKALRAEYAKPIEERDYQALLGEYRAIEVDEENSLWPYIQARIAMLRNEIQRRRAFEEIGQLVKDAENSYQQAKIRRAELDVELPADQKVTEYAAKGVLQPSLLFSDEAAGPKRYLLRDPRTLRIVAYVEPEPLVELAPFVGDEVGLFGTRRFEKGLATRVVRARRVVVLREDVELPSTPRPSYRLPMRRPTMTRPATTN